MDDKGEAKVLEDVDEVDTHVDKGKGINTS